MACHCHSNPSVTGHDLASCRSLLAGEVSQLLVLFAQLASEQGWSPGWEAHICTVLLVFCVLICFLLESVVSPPVKMSKAKNGLDVLA